MDEDRTDQAATFLNLALKTLDEWRHLPAYQLERRVDIFFGLLLPEILEAEYGLPRNHMEVIPEFPLHKGLIVNAKDESRKDHQSVNVDFAVFHQGPDRNRIFLVELKTDNASIKKKQLECMEKAKDKDKGADALLQGVIFCAQNSNSPRKYAHLIRRLDQLGCIEGFGKLSREDWDRERPGLADRFKNLDVGKSWSNAKIECVLLYPGKILPTHSSEADEALEDSSPWLRLVDFLDIAKLVKDSPLSWFLVEWATCEAGRVTPWPIEH